MVEHSPKILESEERAITCWSRAFALFTWTHQLAIANFYEEAEHDVDEGSAANPLAVGELDNEEEFEPQPVNIRPAKKAPKTKKNSRYINL